jgi:Zn ribbon nucleic-acid-binding protein
MARRRLEPACPRCGNEQDLLPWMDGRVYCAECLRCPHSTLSSYVCVLCIRAMHSVLTFRGWRIVDVEEYVRAAWREYGVSCTDLAPWGFHDTESLLEHGVEWQAKEPPHPDDWRVQLPPPHHRFTSSGGSR